MILEGVVFDKNKPGMTQGTGGCQHLPLRAFNVYF
jgi:hypothetical protein